jgi:hypothetical protein
MEATERTRKVYRSYYKRELEALQKMIAAELAAIAEDGERFRHSRSLGGVCRQVTEYCLIMRGVDDVEREEREENDNKDKRGAATNPKRANS